MISGCKSITAYLIGLSQSSPLINRETGEITRVDSGYGTSISRYDENGRDLVEIIKKSIVAWTKIS